MDQSPNSQRFHNLTGEIRNLNQGMQGLQRQVAVLSGQVNEIRDGRTMSPQARHVMETTMYRTELTHHAFKPAMQDPSARQPPPHSPVVGCRQPPPHSPVVGCRQPPPHSPVVDYRQPPPHSPVVGCPSLRVPLTSTPSSTTVPSPQSAGRGQPQ